MGRAHDYRRRRDASPGAAIGRSGRARRSPSRGWRADRHQVRPVTGVGEDVEALSGDALVDWDAAAVDAPGGHVYQSRAWAEHRAATGWEARFLAVGQVRALVFVRPWPGLPGGSAYVPRGPVGSGIPWSSRGAQADAGAGRAIGEGLAAIAAALAADGVDPLAADPEVADDDTAFHRAVGLAGFHRIPEIQPSRHRMTLRRFAGADEAGVFDGVARATRQRSAGPNEAASS